MLNSPVSPDYLDVYREEQRLFQKDNLADLSSEFFVFLVMMCVEKRLFSKKFVPPIEEEVLRRFKKNEGMQFLSQIYWIYNKVGVESRGLRHIFEEIEEINQAQDE